MQRRTERDHQVSQLPALTCVSPQPGPPFASKLCTEMPFVEAAGEERNIQAPDFSFAASLVTRSSKRQIVLQNPWRKASWEQV